MQPENLNFVTGSPAALIHHPEMAAALDLNMVSLVHLDGPDNNRLCDLRIARAFALIQIRVQYADVPPMPAGPEVPEFHRILNTCANDMLSPERMEERRSYARWQIRRLDGLIAELEARRMGVEA